MTYVITESCINCRHTDCVDICPTDAFHVGKNFMAINPVECVDCGLCLPECPEEAIFAENDLTDEQLHYKELNAELSNTWPVILEAAEPFPEHEKWTGKENKFEYLVR